MQLRWRDSLMVVGLLIWGASPGNVFIGSGTNLVGRAVTALARPART